MKFLSPLNLLFVSFLLWLIAFLIVPVTFLYDGSIVFPVIILTLYVSFFAFGILSVKSKVKTLRDEEVYSKRKIQQLVFFLFVIGAFGVLIKLYVGFFKTGIYTASDIFLKRLENMNKELSGGGMGIIAALTYPFAVVSFLISIYHYKYIPKLYFILITLFAFFPFFETFFLGGRTTMVLLGFNIFVVSVLSFLKNSKTPFTRLTIFNRKIFSLPNFFFKKLFYIPVLTLLALFIIYSISVVNKRVTTYQYGNNVFNAWEKKDHHWVKFDNDFKMKYFDSTSETKAKMLGMYGLKRYFALGPVEFVRMVNHLENYTGYYYGQYEFNIFFKFFRFLKIPIKSFTELNTILDRKAVYKTFWGPFYIDFGIFGLVIMFFWGRFVKKSYLRTLQNRTEYVILYGYLATLILSSFFFNSMVGASSYFLFAFLVTILIFKFYPNNLKFVYRKSLSFILLLVFISCSKTSKNKAQQKIIVAERDFVVDSIYKIGDTRRYGVFPDSTVNYKYFKNLDTLIKSGLPVTFSKGNYPIDLEFKGQQNLSLFFDNATINGKINIIDDEGIASKSISLKGNLTVLDKIFIRKSSNIIFQDVTVKSDTAKALTKNKNRGVSIYVGSKDITFDSLKITDTGGSNDDLFKFTAASFQVHGWNDNPENISINKLIINKSARTAAYITGKNHKIKKIYISNYGYGSSENMFGLEDAPEKTQNIFTGLWINKCSNCSFSNVNVTAKNSKEYALKLGLGRSNSPTIIDTLTLDVPYKDELILDDILTNVLVKKLQVSNE